MKKNIAILTIFQLFLLSITPSAANGQEELLYRSDFYCCSCEKHFKTEYLPGKKRQDMGRRDDVLCPDCIKMLGGLDKGLEDLKQKNRDLNELYQKKTSELQRWNQRFYEKGMETFGREWTEGVSPVDGLNGSFGTFFTSMLSVASNWTGPGNVAGGVLPITKQWFGTGLTLVTNGVGIYQTVNDSAGDYSSIPGITDAVTNYVSRLMII